MNSMTVHFLGRGDVEFATFETIEGVAGDPELASVQDELENNGYALSYRYSHYFNGKRHEVWSVQDVSWLNQ